MEKDVPGWLKLDNSARIYPMIYNQNGQNIFRVSCELTERVDPVILRNALKDILPKYPSFNVKLKRGVFWYYFEENRKPPIIFNEADIAADKIDFKANNDYIFRASYYNSTVSLDFDHSVTDGKGGFEFVKALLFRYFVLQGHDIDGANLVRPFDSPPDKGEMEDSFSVNYKPVRIRDVRLNEILGRRGYEISGVPFENSKYGLITGQCDISAIKLAAKKYNATVTEYLGGLLMYSIYKTNYNDHSGKRPIKLLIPINLRRLFGSRTLRNFSFASVVEAEIKSKDITLEYFIGEIKKQLTKTLEEANLRTAVAGIVKVDKNFLVKLLPLPVKYVIFRLIQEFIWKFKTNTAIFTNPGIIDIPRTMHPFIRQLNFFSAPVRSLKLNCATVTHNGEISISFARRCKETDIMKFFFNALTKEGAEIGVVSNYAEL
ncbi:MAG: hypothetical protein LBQ27_04625 [Clostridiales bacterium]|jgi:hypothetical protein|nr:hypothetical protein [Clostridiales bacterium]